MQRRVLAVLTLAVLLVAVPTAALAKGASAATISGGGPGGLPGGPITLGGNGEPGSGAPLADLADQAGVFALLFEDGPGGDLAAAPSGDRGPRYTITWTFPNGEGTEDKVSQDVWPYAAGGPLTFMAPGQPVLGGTTKGGWFQATDQLRLTLVDLGLPARPPVAAAPSPATPTPAAPAPAPTPTAPGRGPWVAAGVALLLAVAAAGALVLRRRSAGAAPAR